MLPLLIAGAALGAYGQIQAGNAADKVANYNSDILRQRAKLTEQAMQSETERMHKQARSLKATQEVGFAKSGAVVSSGTPLMVFAEQAGEMEKDVLQMRRNKMIEAQGLRSEAAMAKYEGEQAKTAARIGAVASLLSAGGKAGMLAGSSGGGASTGTNFYGSYNSSVPSRSLAANRLGL